MQCRACRIKTIVSIVSVLSLVTPLAAAAAAAMWAQPFEGTKWKVTVTPDDAAQQAGEKEFADVLVFKDNKFASEACTPRGFKPVEYEEEMAPGGITAAFTAEPVSGTEGKARWHGTKTGNEMRGEMTWTKPDGTVLNYTFRGERVSR